MKQLIKADSRGKINFDWLKGNYSFSFGNYFDPERVRFGVLRVLNDDFIAPSEGFSTHPHNDMEIITIILKGKLAHKDSTGREHVSGPNGIQVMSAGTGIHHSEYNGSDTETTNSLQIWILPDHKGHKPRYDQSEIAADKMQNEFYLFVGPDESEANLYIHQDAYLSMTELNANQIVYKKHKEENGIYMFVIEGNPVIDDTQLEQRDAITFIDENDIKLSSDNNSKILVIEVPLIEGA